MIRNEHEMLIEHRPSALDIHELTLRESFDRAWRESHEVNKGPLRCTGNSGHYHLFFF
ncbi:Uncharacterised protein [Shigella sonnei]|nr:Uncharacterised protein [Shigella sonnei]